MKLIINEKAYEVEETGDDIIVEGTPFKVTVDGQGPFYNVNVGGRLHKVHLVQGADAPYTIYVGAKVYTVSVERGLAAPSRPSSHPAAGPEAKGVAVLGPGAVTAPLPGKVLLVKVKEGDQVEAGTVLLVLEAMKMENEIRSPKAGVVKEIMATTGANVSGGDCLVVVE